MIKPSRIIRDYQQEAGALCSQLNLYGFIDEHTFLTKSGDLGVVLSVRGVDYECLDHAQLNDVARRFEAAMRIFDEKFRLYQYVLKRDSPPIPHRDYPDNPVLQEAITNRVAYLKRKSGEMYTLEIFFVVLYEGARQEGSRLRSLFQHPAETAAQWLSATKTALFLEGEIDRASSLLANKVRGFVIQLQDSVEPELLAKDAAFRFLRRLLNFAPHKADSVALKHDTFLDYYVCDSNLECHRGHLRLDDHFVKVLTLKEPPAHRCKSEIVILVKTTTISPWLCRAPEPDGLFDPPSPKSSNSRGYELTAARTRPGTPDRTVPSCGSRKWIRLPDTRSRRFRVRNGGGASRAGPPPGASSPGGPRPPISPHFC